MSNLLPLEQQKEIHREYVLRRAIILLAFLLVVLVAAVVFLLPSFVVSYYKKGEMTDRVTYFTQSDAALKEDDTIRLKLHDVNKKLEVVKAPDQNFYIYSLFRTILADQVPGVKLTELSYDTKSSKDGSGYITVGGTALDRESLTVFVNNLSREVVFSSVDLPISNFAKDRDIDFSIQIVHTISHAS